MGKLRKADSKCKSGQRSRVKAHNKKYKFVGCKYSSKMKKSGGKKKYCNSKSSKHYKTYWRCTRPKKK